jgi:hypothetical protein
MAFCLHIYAFLAGYVFTVITSPLRFLSHTKACIVYGKLVLITCGVLMLVLNGTLGHIAKTPLCDMSCGFWDPNVFSFHSVLQPAFRCVDYTPESKAGEVAASSRLRNTSNNSITDVGVVLGIDALWFHMSVPTVRRNMLSTTSGMK